VAAAADNTESPTRQPRDRLVIQPADTAAVGIPEDLPGCRARRKGAEMNRLEENALFLPSRL
jgi:hypothetical protein